MPGGVSISGCIRALADDRQNGSDDLDRRIAQAKAAHEVPAGRAGGSAETKGWAVGVVFVGPVLVAALIGFLIDKGLVPAPWLMIVFVLLGSPAGFRRALKHSKKVDNDPTNKQ